MLSRIEAETITGEKVRFLFSYLHTSLLPSIHITISQIGSLASSEKASSVFLYLHTSLLRSIHITIGQIGSLVSSEKASSVFSKISEERV